MAKEWYLIDNDDDNLDVTTYSDTLDIVMASGIRDRVKLYNSDLTEHKEIDCIISNKAADTYLKSQERKIICHPGIIKSGMYIYDGQHYWLIVGMPDQVYGIYEKAVLLLCQYRIKWQNAHGDIIERWVNATSASKYDVGQYQSNTVITTSNNFTLLMPADYETQELYDKRVFIDTHIPPQKTYRITRDDDILLLHGDKGNCFSFIVSKDEMNPATDNQELGICDYIAPKDSPQNSYIIGSDRLICSTSNIYTCSNSNQIVQWEVNCNFADSLHITTTDDSIEIFVNDINLIGESFILRMLINEQLVDTINVNIINFL